MSLSSRGKPASRTAAEHVNGKVHARTGARQGLRLVVSGVVGIDNGLGDAPALGNLAPAGLGPLPDGAGLLPARAAGPFAPSAAPDSAGCGSELGQRLLPGCLVLLRQCVLGGNLAPGEGDPGGATIAL